MSKTYPECPLYNHDNCKDLHNPKLCAIVRKDKICLKKQQKSKSNKKGLSGFRGMRTYCKMSEC